MNESPAIKSYDSSAPSADEYLRRLSDKEDLTLSEASLLLDVLIDEATGDEQIAGILTKLFHKGETADEVAGLATAMRARSVRVRSRHDVLIDTAGTGGAGRAKTFNVSTAAAFVIAGAGLPVAKHGARAATSASGSADVLSALGVNIETAPETTQAALDELGVCFMFAPLYHRATARVARVRRTLNTRTIFNLVGPLTNPASAPYQLIGTVKEADAAVIAAASRKLGARRVWVARGLDGLDEITIGGETEISETSGDQVRLFKIAPENFGYERLSFAPELCDAHDSARIIQNVYANCRDGGVVDAARQLIVVNAAAALVIAGLEDDPKRAARRAAESIDGGAARQKLDRYREATHAR